MGKIHQAQPFSTLRIRRNVSSTQNQHVQIISKRGNTEDSFAITEINYILKYIKLLSF